MKLVLELSRSKNSRAIMVTVCILLLALVVGISMLIQHHRLYSVNASTHKLLTSSSIDKKLIKVEKLAVSYDAAPRPQNVKQSTTIASQADAVSTSGYQTSIHKDFSQGMNFGGADKGLDFTIAPMFKANNGQYSNGQLIFPISPDVQVFQTFKKNGVKEDIVLKRAPSDTAVWSWRLNLGDKLSAKLLANGNVGIYSSSPMLSGEISASDEKSKAALATARQSDRSNLAFVIPAPTIKNAKGKVSETDVSYTLTDKVLSLHARNLKQQTYPISIDPTVTITSTSDFNTSYSDDGMIDYSTTDQIGRNVIGLGTVGATTQQTNAFTGIRSYHTSVIYNGYLYIIGGSSNGTRQNDIQYCPISSVGTVGTCTQQTGAFTTVRYKHTSVVYNGYLYIIGGTDGTTLLNDVQHCPINSNGSIGTCVSQAAAFTTARISFTSAISSGTLFIAGGCSNLTCTTLLNDVQHCPVNGDGSIGTCVVQAAAFSTARYGHASVTYNGYFYIVGGCSAGTTCTTFQNDIQHCPINADGSLGTCVAQAAAFTTTRYGHAAIIYNGYLFIEGGCSAGNCTTYQNDIQHCPVNTDGTVSTCVQQTTAFTTTRTGHTTIGYNGYLFIIGGTNGTDQNDIQHLLLTAGTPTGVGTVGAATQQTAAFTTARYGQASVAYNGFLYIIGGTDAVPAVNNDIQYCPLNANGSVGACTQQTNAFPTPRLHHSAVAYDGYLYIIGGCYTTSCAGTYLSDIISCPINTNGSIGTCTIIGYFPTPRWGAGAVVYDNVLYLIGGKGSLTVNSIVHCPLVAGGRVNSCVDQTSIFSQYYFLWSTFTYNGYLYAVGGCLAMTVDNCSAGATNDLYYCPINPDKSVGVCTVQVAAFTSGRGAQNTSAYNGYMYLSGGYDGTTFFNDVQHCPINSNGSIGTCVQQAAAFTGGRQFASSVIYDGYLYEIGGNITGFVVQNDISYIPIQIQANVGTYEHMLDFGIQADSVNSITLNGSTKCGISLMYATASSTGIFGSYTYAIQDAKPGETYTLSAVTGVRYFKIRISLDDQSCGATGSNVTDISLSYSSPAPDAPTITAPVPGAVNQSLTPVFQMKTVDSADIYARYKIILYQSDCSTIVRTIDQTASQTGWSGQDSQTSTAYVMGTTLAASTLATYTYQAPALTINTTYCWQAAAIDPGGSNQFGLYSTPQYFSTNFVALAPTLVQPAPGVNGASLLPEFRMFALDQDSDYLKYKIDLCTSSNCSSILATIDQTASQTGWSGQNQQTNTAYVNGGQGIYKYQLASLTPGTQYWWRAYAIDPAGNNVFSVASAIATFTTQSVSSEATITGNTRITGGTLISP